jgi:hypothetical protein
MHALALALSLLGASGDFIVRQTCGPVVLSTAQRTTLGTIFTDTYPTIAASAINSLHCEKRNAGGAICYPSSIDETMTQTTLTNTILAQLNAGASAVVIPASSVAGTRRRDLAPLPLAGADASSLATLLGALCPAAVNLQVADFTQSGSTVTLTAAVWGKLFSPAAYFTAWSALPAGQTLPVVGVVP